MDSAADTLCGWVAPFGDPGINDRSHLPRAFRSVPRPSSPLSAKASTRCPYFALERHTQRQGPFRCQPTPIPRTKPTGAQIIRLDRCDKLSCSGQYHVPPLRRHFVAGSPRSPRPSGMTAGRTRSSRYGHTTRFFTIVNQQHAPAATAAADGNSWLLRRVVSRLLANACRRPGRSLARKLRLHRRWR